MTRTPIRFAIGILIFSVLILASGTALGIIDQSNGTVNVTGKLNNTENITQSNVTQPSVTFVEKTIPEIPKDTEPIVAPEETKSTPEKTVIPEPTKAPGFESIFVISAIFSTMYIFRIRKR